MQVGALRKAFGSSMRTWLSGWAIAALLVAGTWLLESIYLSDNTWQYLGTVVLAYAVVMAWLVAGAVVGLAALLRRHVPVVEPVVHGLMAAVLALAVLCWLWLAPTFVAANS